MTPSLAVLALFAAAPGGNNAMVGVLLEVALIFGIFYFIVIRPQATQRKQHETALRALKKGDEVVTAGGVIGEVVHIKETVKEGTPEKTMEDRVTIKSAESRLVVERGRIARVVPKAGEPSTAP